MRARISAVVLSAILFLSGCSSAFVDLNTPKSSELKEKYSFYQKSVDNIRTTMKVTPEEADEIFTIMCDSGVSNEMNYVTANSDGTFAVWSSGDKYTVTLDNAAVDTVISGGKTLYPAQEETSGTVLANETKLTDKQVKKELKSSIEYYNDTVTSIIPLYAKKEDKEKVKSYLEEAINRLDGDCDKYLQYMNDENLSSDVQEACQNVKTAFYGISETVLKPTLGVINGDTSIDAPDYGTMVIDAQTMYLDKAKELIN